MLSWYTLVGWLSGVVFSLLASINEVNLCRARLVLSRDSRGKTTITMFPHPPLNSKKISFHRPSLKPSFPSPTPPPHHPFPHLPLTLTIFSLTHPSPISSFPSPAPHPHHHFPHPPLSRTIIFLTRNQHTMNKFFFPQLCNHQLSLQL